jgi:hypothetical protein
LDEQPRTEASDILEHLDQLPITGEQRVDLGTDPLGV